MARVFLVEETTGRFDLSGLDGYGEKVHIYPRGNPRPSIFDSEKFIAGAITRLASLGYDPEKDFIAIAGGAIALVLLSVGITNQYDCVTFLFYSHQERAYIPRRLNFEGQPNDPTPDLYPTASR